MAERKLSDYRKDPDKGKEEITRLFLETMDKCTLEQMSPEPDLENLDTEARKRALTERAWYRVLFNHFITEEDFEDEKKKTAYSERDLYCDAKSLVEDSSFPDHTPLELINPCSEMISVLQNRAWKLFKEKAAAIRTEEEAIKIDTLFGEEQLKGGDYYLEVLYDHPMKPFRSHVSVVDIDPTGGVERRNCNFDWYVYPADGSDLRSELTGTLLTGDETGYLVEKGSLHPRDVEWLKPACRKLLKNLLRDLPKLVEDFDRG